MVRQKRVRSAEGYANPVFAKKSGPVVLQNPNWFDEVVQDVAIELGNWHE